MRLAISGLFATLMALCARLVQIDWGGYSPQAKFGFAPPSLIVPSPAVVDAVEGRVLELEGLVAGIQADTLHLRNALRQMRVSGGIVPAFATANPVSAEDVRPASGIEPKPAPVAAIADPGHVSADLYAPAADLLRARSLFYGAQLGIFASRRQAVETWQMVENAPQLAGLSPRYLGQDGGVRLLVGPMPAAEAEAVCAGLRPQASECSAIPFDSASQ